MEGGKCGEVVEYKMEDKVMEVIEGQLSTVSFLLVDSSFRFDRTNISVPATFLLIFEPHL